MDEFLIELQAILDQEKSKGNIDDGIRKIQEKINGLKVQAEIDPQTISNLTKELENIINQKITLSNINIDNGQVSKTGRQIGQQIGTNINNEVNAKLNGIKQLIDDITKEFNSQSLNSYDLLKIFNLNQATIDSSVIQQVRDLTKELNVLSKEALKTNSDSSWEGIANKINSLSIVLDKFGKNRDLSPFKESLDILDYFQNKKIFIGDKSEVLQNTGMYLSIEN